MRDQAWSRYQDRKIKIQPEKLGTSWHFHSSSLFCQGCFFWDLSFTVGKRFPKKSSGEIFCYCLYLIADLCFCNSDNPVLVQMHASSMTMWLLILYLVFYSAVSVWLLRICQMFLTVVIIKIRSSVTELTPLLYMGLHIYLMLNLELHNILVNKEYTLNLTQQVCSLWVKCHF